VLAAVTTSPHISIRQIARDTEVHQCTVHKILRSHPYHVNLLHDLHDEDFNNKI